MSSSVEICQRYTPFKKNLTISVPTWPHQSTCLPWVWEPFHLHKCLFNNCSYRTVGWSSVNIFNNTLQKRTATALTKCDLGNLWTAVTLNNKQSRPSGPLGPLLSRSWNYWSSHTPSTTTSSRPIPSSLSPVASRRLLYVHAASPRRLVERSFSFPRVPLGTKDTTECQ